MRVFILDHQVQKLVYEGSGGYFKEVELKTGAFCRDLVKARMMHKIYAADIMLLKKNDQYIVQKAKQPYHYDRIVNGKNKLSHKEVLRMFGKHINNKSFFNLTLREGRHYAHYAQYYQDPFKK